MIITTWNVRGMQQPFQQPVVVDFVKTNRVDVMGLIETKLLEKNIGWFMSRYFPAWKYVFVLVSPDPRRPNKLITCRMLLLWNPCMINLDVVSIEEQVIHTKIRCTRSRNEFYFSLVYGLHSPEIRQILWDSLVNFGMQGEPYLISGDFNAIMHVDERRGRKKPDNREMDGPIRACARLGIQDTPCTGCTFTWSNGTVFSKIDRAMVNQEWQDKGFIVNTTFMPPGFQTDHSLAKTKIFGDVKSYPKPFKFFNCGIIGARG